MTIQETIDKVWTLLERLETMPNGADVDIMAAEVRDFGVLQLDAVQIQLRNGIDTVGKNLGLPVKDEHTEKYVRRTIHWNGCEYVQLNDTEKEEETQ